jgi:hypothetical protein
MKRFAFLAAGLALLAGCASVEPTPSAQVSPSGVYVGEVWTWDERTNIVTLRTGATKVRVQTTPDTIARLRMHEMTAIRGTLAPPENLEHVVGPSGPMRAEPEGSAQQSEMSGTIATADPKGLVAVDAAGKRMTVWTATTDTSRFRAGTPVRVRTSVQGVRMVPVTSGGATAPDPSAMVSSEPGDHAIVVGRVTSVDPSGAITVESPRGPITVPVTNASTFPVGSHVQVRTSLIYAQ